MGQPAKEITAFAHTKMDGLPVTDVKGSVAAFALPLMDEAVRRDGVLELRIKVRQHRNLDDVKTLPGGAKVLNLHQFFRVIEAEYVDD
jgi:hypothetical protein